MPSKIQYRIWDTKENKYFEPFFDASNGRLKEVFVDACGEINVRDMTGISGESMPDVKDRYIIEQMWYQDEETNEKFYEGDIFGYDEQLGIIEVKQTHAYQWILKFGEWEFDNGCDYGCHGGGDGWYVEGRWTLYRTDGTVDVYKEIMSADAMTDKCKLLGNIRENPELMKGSE